MAAQGKSTGLQIGLILAVAVAVVAVVAAFIIYKNDAANQAKLVALADQKESTQAANQKLREELEAVKQTVGVTASKVGLNDAVAGTVLGELGSKIERLGPEKETTLVQVAENLAASLAAQERAVEERIRDITALEKKLNDREGQYDREKQEFRDQTTAAVNDRADVQTATEERVRAEEARRQELEDQLAATRAELEEERERLGNQIVALKDESDNYRNINSQLRAKLEGFETGRFTTPDAKIVSTQRTTGMVYLDIGARQKLRPGVTFSVYDKDKVGPSGGDAAALKGSIEVVSVGDRISEARVTEVTTQEPLSTGDPVFSPAWSPGRSSKFAFVGMIDLDGDGSTAGERDRLRRILDDAGAEISVYVDDDGEWVDGDGDPTVNQPIDLETEMVVHATIPDPSEVTDPARKAAFTKMRQARGELREQALQMGIPFKPLKTFLDSIGYVETRRRFAPGDDSDFNARNDGSRAADPNPGQQTSGLYDQNRGRRGSQPDPQPSTRFNPR